MSSIKDSLGDRIKSYENSYRISLPIRMPIIVRVDGKSFHQYTKGLNKPVDERLVNCMNETAKFLCQNIQGCQIAYVQSDEISLLLNNFKTLETQSWHNNVLQKMVSVSAAMASAKFTSISNSIFGATKLAMFDSRIFIIPKEEVCNYFIWRQQDATRNSVQMLARSLYSHKECIDKNNSDLQELCFQKGINWNNCPVSQKRGRCIIKKQNVKSGLNPISGITQKVFRSDWAVDNNIPIFSLDRKYIEQYLSGS